MENLSEKAKVVLSSVVTWATVASATVALVLDEIEDYVEDQVSVPSWVTGAVAVLATVLGVLTLAIRTLRRVTPVLEAERGILPVDPEEQARAYYRAAGFSPAEVERLVAGRELGGGTFDDDEPVG